MKGEKNMDRMQFTKPSDNSHENSGDWWLWIVLAVFIAVLLVEVFTGASEHDAEQERHERVLNEYYASRRLFATDKVTVTDRYLAATANGKGIRKCVTVKFNGENYYISDDKLYDKAKKGDRLKGYYRYDSNCEKTLYSADGKKAEQTE